MAKQPSIKAETLKDLAERLEPERTAYQSALKRGDYETAQSIKDMVNLILSKAM
jgi:protein-arginine kinase activator protein McsA